MKLFYKLFTWITLILTALFGTAIVSFLLGNLAMYAILNPEEAKAAWKNDPPQ